MVDTDVGLDKILKYSTNLRSAQVSQGQGCPADRAQIGTSGGSTPRTTWGIWSLLEDLGIYGVRATPYSAQVAI